MESGGVQTRTARNVAIYSIECICPKLAFDETVDVATRQGL